MISYKLRKSHPQISEMWVKVAARLALAGDAFSLADAVEGAWLSGEAASGFTSVSWTEGDWEDLQLKLVLGLLQHGIVIFEYVWHIAFLLHRLSGVLKKCLGLLLTSMFTVIASLTQTYECRFPTRCLKKALEPWDSDTFVILALKSFSQIYKSIAITWET